MILADKIINLRKKNGWSQEELAEKLGVTRQSISKYEGAQSIPDLDKILKLSEIFGVTTDYLIKDELEEEEYAPSQMQENESESDRSVQWKWQMNICRSLTGRQEKQPLLRCCAFYLQLSY